MRAADFFEHQDVARRLTGRLVVLFGLAVLAITATIYLIVVAVFGYLSRDPLRGGNWSGLWNAQLLTVVFLATALVVAAGSLYKILQLRAGGRVIAEELGGRLVTVDTATPAERRLLNVVEEMAIASGIPTPLVYILDAEQGINAFAAGFEPEDAVIGVTRGSAERLSRDELQGVIAHEFSHILHGDMRLNIRLIGLVHGILIVGIIGYYVVRASVGGRRRPLPLVGLGLGLMAVGFVGTVFGNLVKAGVSRQREFLADASAVQYTRNPAGIAGALKKIGGWVAGSKIEHPNAPEASHMFFGEGVSGLTALFATHPSLAERIRRLDPTWDEEFPAVEVAAPVLPEVAAAASGFAGAPPPGALGGAAAARAAVAQVGQPTPAHLDYAAHLLARLPPAVATAVHEPYGARAVVYALLLDRRPEPRQIQLERLARRADPSVYRETTRLWPAVRGLDALVRLPLVSLAIPALRTLTPGQYGAFRANVEELVRADETIEVFEWALQRILLHDLERQFSRVKPARVRYPSLEPLASECELLLSTLAHVGHRSAAEAEAAFAQADRDLGLPGVLRLAPRERCTLDALDPALEKLADAAPRLKRQVLMACALSITADRAVTAAEAELLRAVSASLGCPMPPLLPA